ncbi:MAG: Type II secretory pathway, pullulanase PulA [Pseudomonadota bacterium]
MILSRGRRFLLIHPPKTAGTSVMAALEARAIKDDILLGDTPKAKRRRHRVGDVKSAGRLWKHSRLSDLPGLLLPGELETLRVVCLARNPWDRVVSYYYWLQEQRFAHPAVERSQTRSFSAFLAHPDTQSELRRSNCVDYVRDGSGEVRCDLFLRFESLAEDMKALENLLDIKLPTLVHLNASARPKAYQMQYSDTDRSLLADLAAPDIDHFGYTFTTSAKPLQTSHKKN